MDELGGPLRVGFVLDASLHAHGGVQQYVLMMGDWMRRQGHEVSYLVGHGDGSHSANVYEVAKNVTVAFNGNRVSVPLPRSGARLRRLVAEPRFDVLHVQVPYSPFLAHRVILTSHPETAIVGTFHIAPYGWPMVWLGTALGAWVRRSLKRFDRIVSVSPTAASFASSAFGLATSVVPNAVDYARFADAQPLVGLRDPRPTVLFLGRLVPRKGCGVLLEAVRRVVADPRQRLRVFVCGEGPLRGSLESYTRHHGLTSTVSFVGAVAEKEKPQYYASADICVFPSNGGESFGIVLLEAMASGRAAVLGGDNPGYRSVLDPQPGLLFDPRDPPALAASLRRLLADPVLTRRLASWGARYARRFDINVVGPRLLDIYRSACSARRPDAPMRGSRLRRPEL